MATSTLDQKIEELTKRKAYLTEKIAYINSNIPDAQAYVRRMIAEGNYAEASKVSASIEASAADRAGAMAELKTISETLPILLEQKQIALNAQNALVNQLNTQSSNSLSADQQLQIALAKAEADRANASRASMDSEATKASGSANTNRNYIIGGIIAVVIVVVIIVLKRKK